MTTLYKSASQYIQQTLDRWHDVGKNTSWSIVKKALLYYLIYQLISLLKNGHFPCHKK